jgi:hypothetical protein
MDLGGGVILTWLVATINSSAGSQVDDLHLVVGANQRNDPDLMSVFVIHKRSSPWEKDTG